MADAVETAAAPKARADTPYTRRARYFDSANAFNLHYPDVPAHSFADECARALDAATGTALIPLDLSAAMGLAFPATTPLVLARYGRIAKGGTLVLDVAATVEIYYAIAGSGESRKGADRIAWGAGDVFALPGGGASEHRADGGDALLWIVTNEPELAFEGADAPAPERSGVQAVHFPAAEIDRQLAAVERKIAGTRTPGLAVVFSSASQEARRNISPSLTLAMNQLQPHSGQLPHRHNSVAVSLPILGERCYSMMDGVRYDWQPYTTTVTPPGSVHSHHNDGDRQAMWLIVQDGGLHYHCRTMGFEYADQAP
jgi:gentisate 1,2-dioxygenase